MRPRIPSVPQRMKIVLYGVLMIIALLVTTAIGLPGRAAQPRSAAALGPTATGAASVTLQPTIQPTVTSRATSTQPPSVTVRASATRQSASETAGPSRTPTRTATRTASATPSPTATPSATPSPTATFTPSLTPTATLTATPPPTPVPGAANRELCVPILTYHHIGYAPADADDIELGLTTSPELFEQHLRLFQENEVAVIGLDDLQYALALGWPLPEKRTIITIDDAYDDVYQYAFPLLKKYGMHATIFVPTTFIDMSVPGYMTWPQIEEMAQAGNDIQPHTKDHVDLRRRTRDYLIYQILGSKETVEAHTGRIARFFAYPAGEYDDNAIEILKELNFWSAVSTDSGVVHSLDTVYKLKRLRVSNSIDAESMKVYMRYCDFDVP